jgi:hypothetical protein
MCFVAPFATGHLLNQYPVFDYLRYTLSGEEPIVVPRRSYLSDGLEGQIAANSPSLMSARILHISQTCVAHQVWFSNEIFIICD